jgi:proteasome lid subunit RPN8/RPN11
MRVPKGPSIRMQAEVTRQIRQHCRTSMSTEVCGVLIGDLHEAEGAVEIFAAIAGANAAQAGTHVTFTQDTWEHIYKVKDVEYPEARIVGWYHSHPGFGVFLSEHDTFIQENFFSAENQVAWVFDPHTDEEGCFGWVEGKIARLGSITVEDSDPPAKVSESREIVATGERQDEEKSEAPTKGRRMRTGAPPRWLRWLASVSALLVMMLLGFAISRVLFPVPYPLLLPVNPLTGQPLLRDSKSGEAVYIDPQSRRYLTVDPRSGKVNMVDLATIKSVQPSEEGNPFLQPPGAVSPPADLNLNSAPTNPVAPAPNPVPNKEAPKEKK